MSSHRILLTGANGFVGSHILRQLLPRPNVSVRAVVRSSLKIETVKNDFGSFSNLDFAIVPDITAPNAFHEALSKTDVPFDTVIHTASPFLYKAVSDNREFLNPAVRGTTEILESVKAVAPDVKRVIVTSSFASVGDLANVDAMRGKNYTEEDWNPITWDEAVSTSVKNVWYQASKKFAEVSIVLQLRLDFSTLTLSKKAAWDFIETEKPGFDVVTLCPPMVYGPLEHTVKKTSDLNESTARIYNLFINSKKDAPLPPDALYIYVDPREVAAAHIAAVFTPEAGNQRFVICAGQIASQTISDVLRAKFPELAERTPLGKPGVSSLPDEAERYTASSEKARKILGIEFRPVEETLEDMGAQLLAIEKASA